MAWLVRHRYNAGSGMNISKETAALCLNLLGQVQLSATDPELEAKVAQVVKARDELAAVADETQAP